MIDDWLKMRAVFLKGLKTNINVLEQILLNKDYFAADVPKEEILALIKDKIMRNIKQELDLLYKTQSKILFWEE